LGSEGVKRTVCTCRGKNPDGLVGVIQEQKKKYQGKGGKKGGTVQTRQKLASSQMTQGVTMGAGSTKWITCRTRTSLPQTNDKQKQQTGKKGKWHLGWETKRESEKAVGPPEKTNVAARKKGRGKTEEVALKKRGKKNMKTD